jgi:hypothetical protein
MTIPPPHYPKTLFTVTLVPRWNLGDIKKLAEFSSINHCDAPITVY